MVFNYSHLSNDRPLWQSKRGNLNRLIFVMLFIATTQLILFSKVAVVIINYTSRFVIVVICCRATTIFPVVHERKWYFNWFIATYTIFSRGKHSTLRALRKIKHSSALSSCMASYNKYLVHYSNSEIQLLNWDLLVALCPGPLILCFLAWPSNWAKIVIVWFKFFFFWVFAITYCDRLLG